MQPQWARVLLAKLRGLQGSARISVRALREAVAALYWVARELQAEIDSQTGALPEVYAEGLECEGESSADGSQGIRKRGRRDPPGDEGDRVGPRG